MKKILFKLLKIYCLILITALVMVGLKQVTKPVEVIIPLLLLPICEYFLTSFFKIKKRFQLPLLIYGLLFSIVIFIAEIINVKKSNEIIVIMLTLPLPLFFIIESKTKMRGLFIAIKQKLTQKEKNENEPEISKEEVDESRRKFIKIAAGTSLATAIMFFLKKQNVGAAFFGSGGGPSTVAVKDLSGNKVDPAQKQPLDGYNISDIDDSGSTHYYGFVNKDGAWYILQENSNMIRYVKGANNYATAITGAWINRNSQTYGVFNDVF